MNIFYDFENEKYLKIPENIYEAKEFIENYKLSENSLILPQNHTLYETLSYTMRKF